MCGIAGVILRQGRPEAAPLEKAVGLLKHRGPDDHGVHVVASVGLAHTRLSIIDLAGGHQPIIDLEGRYALVANGEVYNFVELRSELERGGCQFATGSDSETILHVYDRYGVRGFSRLHGMFAFALYAVHERRLLLARDRLGIKPLYYVELPDRIAFASELKALLPLLPRAPEISAPALACFLDQGFNSLPESILKDVRRLEPGTALVIGEGLAVDRVTYWSPLDIVPRASTLDDAVEEFDGLFDQVLREHMRSDVPYGLFLSGGIDSGNLLARLSALNDRPIQTYSVGYEGQEDSDELMQARRVAALFGSEHRELRLDPRQALAALPLSVWFADDLMYDAACLPTALLAQRAGRDLKVVFTGEGGDEVFAGYGRYRRNPLQRAAKRLPRWLGGGYRARSRWDPAVRRQAFGGALLQGASEASRPLQDTWHSAPAGWSFLRKAQLSDIRSELKDGLLVKVDRMLMAFGLEGRVPYLDHRVVELGLSLPDRLKVRGRVGKVLLRTSAARWLPADQLRARKRGFGVPLGALLQGKRLDDLAKRLADSRIIKEWLNPQAVPALVRLQAGTGRATRPLLQLAQLAIWHALLFENPGARIPSVADNFLDWII